MPCHALLWYGMPFYAMPCYGVVCLSMPCLYIPCICIHLQSRLHEPWVRSESAKECGASVVLQQYSPLCSSGTEEEGMCWSGTTTIFLSSGSILSCGPVLIMKCGISYPILNNFPA
jgi:hypothetical protein